MKEGIIMRKTKIVCTLGPSSSSEKELEAIHLSVPFGYALASKLREKGMDVPPELHDMDALEDYLCQ